MRQTLERAARRDPAIQDLWADQAVGILGGEPKCCKSFLALDAALSMDPLNRLH